MYAVAGSPHHLLSLVPNRVAGAVERLRESIWENYKPLAVEVTRASPVLVPFEAAQRQPRTRARIPAFWGKLFDQRWCRMVISPGCNQWLNWRDQGEATVYIGGEPYAGFDVAHRHWNLPADGGEVWVASHCMETAIWHSEAKGLGVAGSLFEGAFICQRNDRAWEAYHDFKCLLDLLLEYRVMEQPGSSRALNSSGYQMSVDRISPQHRLLLRRLDQAADALDRFGVSGLSQSLRETYQSFRNDHPVAACCLTGHAHIDLVYLWPERIGEVKAVHTFSTVNRLLDQYPEMRFAYSQPASYEAVGRREPRLMDRVRQRINSGSWQAGGAMYVESDTQLPCGEALLRCFTIGQERFRVMNGRDSTVTWLPDVFGYSACLPQIMLLTGAGALFTTKMTWNAINRFPHSSFVWRGSDGSEVIAHVTQEVGYLTTVQVAEIVSATWNHRQSDVHPECLLPTGYGDGGGGPTAEMCERARRLDALSGLPRIQWDQPEAFFARLEAAGAFACSRG